MMQSAEMKTDRNKKLVEKTRECTYSPKKVRYKQNLNDKTAGEPDSNDHDKSPSKRQKVLQDSQESMNHYDCSQCSKLDYLEFDKGGVALSKHLLGKVLIRKVNQHILAGRIVETEAYLGEIDKACHTFGGKVTERTKAMYMPPGTSYVYSIYGMYYCLNISSADKGGCSLIRALQPLAGV